MTDYTDELAKKFEDGSRHANFGECLNSLKINGFRGVECEIDIDYPVTALTGLNGTGKTTVGQLILCAYRSPSSIIFPRHTINRYFPKSSADLETFSDDSTVTYTYKSDDLFGERSVTISRVSPRWEDYRRQPFKASISIDPRFYLPRYGRTTVTDIDEDTLSSIGRIEIAGGNEWVSKILGSDYEDVTVQPYKFKRSGIGIAKRLSANYSENNMGFGEGRVIHAVWLMETCPERSLVVIDEPDIGLHVSAQREFSKYLLSVSCRRGHQIFYTTHSSAMIEELPPEGRKMLERGRKGVKVINEISSPHIRNVFSDSLEGYLIICVEDHFAENLLMRIILKHEISIFGYIKIHVMGSHSVVRGSVSYLRRFNVGIIGVLDGDQEVKKGKGLFTLPSDGLPPEKTVFLSKQVQSMLKRKYKFDFSKYMSSNKNVNHHKYSILIGEGVGRDRQQISLECIDEYVKRQPKDWCKDLIDNISSAIKAIRKS